MQVFKFQIPKIVKRKWDGLQGKLRPLYEPLGRCQFECQAPPVSLSFNSLTLMPHLRCCGDVGPGGVWSAVLLYRLSSHIKGTHTGWCPSWLSTTHHDGARAHRCARHPTASCRRRGQSAGSASLLTEFVRKAFKYVQVLGAHRWTRTLEHLFKVPHGYDRRHNLICQPLVCKPLQAQLPSSRSEWRAWLVPVTTSCGVFDLQQGGAGWGGPWTVSRHVMCMCHSHC